MKREFFASVKIAVLLCAVACLVSGCVSTKEPSKEPAAAERTSPAAPGTKKPAPGQTAPTAKAAQCIISLESNPSTGFSWACEIANPAVAELEDIVYKGNAASEKIAGAGGYEHFVFTCKQPGSTGLTFTYRRPWKGGEIAEVRRAQLIVDDRLNGKVTFF
ncbi:MAG: protease inhibitor I42 family protein [Treponema sp.]|nr:protease inhibitor I42 family protein [Treponema sp.]